ncbi:hypothetical protein GCM10010052_41900 [Paenarthrobacter histidinolovorans]|nr:hypothetical protein GCM10010052_41900 [Paenarthrobacter histidinolovorans]
MPTNGFDWQIHVGHGAKSCRPGTCGTDNAARPYRTSARVDRPDLVSGGIDVKDFGVLKDGYPELLGGLSICVDYLRGLGKAIAGRERGAQQRRRVDEWVYFADLPG